MLAALWSQVRRLSATALVGVEARPVPDQASLRQLAQYMSHVLESHGSGILKPDVVLKAAKSAGDSLSAAASNSFMYI